MIRRAGVLSFAVVFGLGISGLAQALPGVAPEGTAIGQYDPATGQIIVSGTNINSWRIESIVGDVMTGDDASSLPMFGGLYTDSDTRIGEVSISLISFTNANLGNVAQTGLPDDGNLRIFWTSGLGVPTLDQPLLFGSGVSNAAPMADISGPHVIDLLNDPLNLTLDASGSTDDGDISSLTYSWDLDDDEVYEIHTGTSPYLNIADVTSTFGGHGYYPIDVQVSDGQFSDIAQSSVQLFSEPIVPAHAQYDPATGQIIVSTYGVMGWYVESTSDSLTGDEPNGLPAKDGLITNSDTRIGESLAKSNGYTVDLGNVAEPGLPLEDLRIVYVVDVGSGILSDPVSMPVFYAAIVPEPSGLVLVMVGLIGVSSWRRKIWN